MNTNTTPVASTSKTSKLGRKPLKLKLPSGPFTLKQLFALNSKANGGTVKCELTVRNHIERGLASGKLVKLAEKLNTGNAGAPAFRFQLKAAAEYNAKRKTAKVAPVATAAV